MLNTLLIENSRIDNKVLRNTFALLGTTMIPTLIGALIGLNMNFSFMAASPILSSLFMLGFSFGMLYLIRLMSNNAIGIILLYVFTFVLGVFLGPILQYALHFSNGGKIIALAGASTAIIFITLSVIASTTRRNFSFLGNFLSVGIILLIITSLANLFLQIPIMSLVLSGVSVLLFSGFILYDINRIVHGGETNYIMATVSIYMSIYNLFVNLLQIMLAILGNRN